MFGTRPHTKDKVIYNTEYLPHNQQDIRSLQNITDITDGEIRSTMCNIANAFGEL